MTVTLEALAAREGDALLLRFGTEADPVLWLIDGGPSGVYRDAIKPRLQQLRTDRQLGDEDPLRLDLVAVTHVDADHVRGVLDLFGDLVKADTPPKGPAPYRIARMWHNSFDVLAGDSTAGAVGASLSIDLSRLEAQPPVDFAAKAASIGEGRRLADLIHRFGRADNQPFKGLVLAPRVLTEGMGGATVTVVGPTMTQLKKLADEWEKEVGQAIDRGDLAAAAAYVDRSVTNLSSIALHVDIKGRALLLTGDARGDHLLAGIQQAGLFDADGECRVDILKVPHHGSDRNLEKEFFEQVIANHYVISADGKHDNPSIDVLDWIVDTQGKREYEIHLTYGDAMGAADHLRERHTGSRNYSVRVRGANELAVAVTV